MGALTILGVAQEFCALRGLPIPSALIGANEKSAAQYLAIIKKLSRELARYSWQEQRILTTYSATGLSTNQGSLSTLFAGYKALVPETLWNKTKKLRIIGPVNDQQWAAQQALGFAGPEYLSWVSQKQLYISPKPAEFDQIQAIYQTEYSLTNNSGVAIATPTADNDKFLQPDNVVMKGFEAIWKKQKGEPFTDDWNDFVGEILRALAYSGMPKFRLDGATPSVRPGIAIPPGSWNV